MLDSIKITLKSHFWRKNVIILSLCTRHCYEPHNISRKTVNHKWIIDFIAWHYFTPRRHMIIYATEQFLYKTPPIITQIWI